MPAHRRARPRGSALGHLHGADRGGGYSQTAAIYSHPRLSRLVYFGSEFPGVISDPVGLQVTSRTFFDVDHSVVFTMRRATTFPNFIYTICRETGLPRQEVGGGLVAMTNAPREEFFQLSAAGRLELVEELWDSIADEHEALALTDEQREDLERRLAEADADPSGGSPSEDIGKQWSGWWNSNPRLGEKT